MEPVENEEGQRDSGDDAPGQQAVELSLHALGDVAMGHESVEHPEGDVGKQEEGDQLSTGLGQLVGFHVPSLSQLYSVSQQGLLSVKKCL